jgi:hypothetical protein
MLFVLTGSSCSGKTTIAFPVGERLTRIAVHDFDEVGVPGDADHRWRHRTTETWIQRALGYQDHGVDLLLTAQSPLGEILASPSAPLLDGIALCLVDVSDDMRRARLTSRDPGRWNTQRTGDFLGWAAWHRGHATDPRHRPHVITADSWPPMAWERWTSWTSNDPRWHTDRLDTTDQTVTESIACVEQWISEQRDAHRAGNLPLQAGCIPFG